EVFDVSYNYLTKTHVFLPGDGAGLMLFGNNLPGYKDCQDVTLKSEGIVFATLVGENHLCYKTDQGRLGRISIIGYDEINKLMTINFVTWVTQ
ncbi:MAG: hypothetical protein MUO40_00850, partial [Anaerolineaceae bacterium]|nr:hypothetical protein [Anaerolineaceae bacterium]